MTDPIMSYASIMRAQIKRLDSVAQNASNVNTSGYLAKQTVISSENFLSLVSGGTSNAKFTEFVDTKAGVIQKTGEMRDIAVDGNEWIVVDSGDNGRFYARSARLSMNERGELITQNGGVVLSESGTPIIADEFFLIAPDGTVSIDQLPLAKLLIVTATKNARVTAAGNNLYSISSVEKASQPVNIVQGALNASNVDTSSDMVKMMEITRSVETLQRAISAYDSMLKVGINELGK